MRRLKMKIVKDKRTLKWKLSEPGLTSHDRLLNFFRVLYDDDYPLLWTAVDIPTNEYHIDSLRVGNILEMRYLFTNKSHILSVRWSDGKFWIMSEDQSSKDFELSDENIDEFITYSEGLEDPVPNEIFYCYGTGDQLYKVNVKDQTCTCKGFQYKYSRHPVGREERLCKHMQSIFTTYPDLLPQSLLEADIQSNTPVDGKTRYPRDLFAMYVSDIMAVIKSFDNIINRVEVCGSYRRMCEMVSDLDILVTLKPGVESWSPFLDYLENEMGYSLISDIGRGEAKAAYLIDGLVHVDFKVVPEESWPFALLHFTGSKNTNIEMRRKAISMGCHLNEYGLFYNHDESPVPGIKTEQDVFNFLRIPYREPWQR